MSTSLAERVRGQEPEYTQVNVRMTVDRKQELADLAASEGISLTDLVNVACEDALVKYSAPAPKRKPRRRAAA